MMRTAFLAASLGALLLADSGAAQAGRRAVPAPRPPAPRPMPPQAVPITPVTNHPAYAAQPLIGNDEEKNSSKPNGPRDRRTKSEGPAGPAKSGPAIKRAVVDALEFRKTKIEGKELARRVDKVNNSLRWYQTLTGACVSSAGTGKPVLWIHSLGELDGYA